VKNIKRYFFINGVDHESDDGRWVRFDECENYISARDHVINELEHRIKELESDEHINKIKAQGIEYAVEYGAFDCTVYDDPVAVLEKVERYAKILRGNE